jgi:hypothetical protein
VLFCFYLSILILLFYNFQQAASPPKKKLSSIEAPGGSSGEHLEVKMGGEKQRNTLPTTLRLG